MVVHQGGTCACELQHCRRSADLLVLEAGHHARVRLDRVRQVTGVGKVEAAAVVHVVDFLDDFGLGSLLALRRCGRESMTSTKACL